MKQKASLIVIGILGISLIILSSVLNNEISDLNASVKSLHSNIYILEENKTNLERSLESKTEELQDFFDSLAWVQEVVVSVVEDDIDYDEFQDFELSFTLNERNIDSTLRLLIYKVDITGTNEKELYSEEVITSDTMDFSIDLTLSVLNDYEFYLEEVNGDSIRYEVINRFLLNRSYGIRFSVAAGSVSGDNGYEFEVTVKNIYNGINAFKVESALIEVYYKGVLEGTHALLSGNNGTIETLTWQLTSSRKNAVDDYYYILTFYDYTGDEHISDFGSRP